MKKLVVLMFLIVCLSTENVYAGSDIHKSSHSEAFKVYRYAEYGYEVQYPENYYISISGGHSPAANPEYGMRLSMYSKYSRIILDIDSIDKVTYRDKYQNVEEFIRYKQLSISFVEDLIINGKHNKIYKLHHENYYFSFFENDKYIFELSSSSKDFLKQIMATFKFI